MVDTGLLLIIALAGGSFGFFVGYFLRGLFRQNDKPQEKVEEAVVEEVVPVQKEAPDPNWGEAATLWRDRSDGQLIFEVGRKFFKPGDDVSAKERQALLKIFRSFYLWLEPASTAAPQSPLQAESVTKVGSNGSSPSLHSNTTPLSSSKVTINPANMISNALRADVPGAKMSELNMVAQVDEILQKKLIQADMQKWAVRLVDFPNKGMVVMVGLEQYVGIDEVPYERVRKIIRESVMEWERRVDAQAAQKEESQSPY